MRTKLKPVDYALFLLKLRDRSVGEIRDKMKRKDFSESEIQKTLDFLIEKNFVDDERFARNYVRNKLLEKPVGKYYLTNKLRQKFISTEIIEKTLLAVKEGEANVALEAAERFLRRNSNLPKEKIYQKLSRHLISRGFGWEEVKVVVDKKLER